MVFHRGTRVLGISHNCYNKSYLLSFTTLTKTDTLSDGPMVELHKALASLSSVSSLNIKDQHFLDHFFFFESNINCAAF